ncbi:hypothetical protein OAO74_04045 [Euryarchaeota archaeon]|jgi:hypothetical protein|nr:hypothetical protein [Euryarchaeota archaeon]
MRVIVPMMYGYDVNRILLMDNLESAVNTMYYSQLQQTWSSGLLKYYFLSLI